MPMSRPSKFRGATAVLALLAGASPAAAQSDPWTLYRGLMDCRELVVQISPAVERELADAAIERIATRSHRTADRLFGYVDVPDVALAIQHLRRSDLIDIDLIWVEQTACAQECVHRA